MPTYLTPGVYVEEVPPAARPIAGVSTSTAGLIGVVDDGVTMPLRPGRSGLKPDGSPEPADHYTVTDAKSPTFVTSWAEFKNSFGDFQQGNLALAHAVYGFFNNGGTRCYVVRVSKPDDLTDPTPLLDLLEPHDDVSIVAVPGATSKIQHDKILTHCSNLGDRVAVLDGNAAASLSDPPTAIAPAGRSSQGSFGAVYFPNIVVFDPLAPRNGAAAGTQPITTIAPSGHIAGIYARTDATRGVFKAPANEPVLGALDVSLRLSDRHQAKLNPEGVNVLRFFSGSITVWRAYPGRRGAFRIPVRQHAAVLQFSAVVDHPGHPVRCLRAKLTRPLAADRALGQRFSARPVARRGTLRRYAQEGILRQV